MKNLFLNLIAIQLKLLMVDLTKMQLKMVLLKQSNYMEEKINLEKLIILILMILLIIQIF